MKVFIILFFSLLFAKEPLKVVLTDTWQPFNMRVDGRLEGIGVDFWKLVAKKAGLEYEFVTVNRWDDVLDAIKDGKAALTISTDITPERLKYAVFTKPYVTYPLVIATQNNVGFIFDLNDLRGKKIAVGKNYTAAVLMKKHFPDLKYVFTKNIEEALCLVKNSKVFSAVDILPVISFNINKFEFSNLKIAGQVPLNFNVRFMLSKKYSYLLPEFDKIISGISYEEKQRIFNKYIKVPRKISFDRGEIIFYVLVIIIVGIMFVVWIYTLKVEIKKLKQNNFNKKDYDKLTGTLKTEKIKEIVNDKFKDSAVTVIVFDIVGFRNINRFYGHHFGDITLLELTSFIKSELKSDEYIGRIKGGTFIVITDKGCKRGKKLFEKIHNFSFSIVNDLTTAFVVKRINSDFENELKNMLLILKDNKKKYEYFTCL